MADDSTTMKVEGQEMTWGDVVKKYGLGRARALAPELDPLFQRMSEKEGHAKAVEDYSKKYVDPNTGMEPAGSLWESQSTWEEQMKSGIQDLKSRGGLIPGLIAAGGQAVLDTGGIAQGLFGGGPKKDPKAAAPSKPSTTTTTPAAAQPESPQTAIDSMFSGLSNQYQSAMATVNPYISGQMTAPSAQTAQAIGEGIAGAGVQGQNAASAAMLNNAGAKYVAANNAGVQGIQNALKDTGLAVGEYAQASPYLSLLQALSSEATYQTETAAQTGSLPAAFTKSNLPTAVTQAIADVGQSSGTSVSVPKITTNPTATTPSTDTSSSQGSGGV